MKKGMKKLLIMGLAAGLAVLAAFPALAGQWKKLDGGQNWQWWYEEEDGTYPVSSWKEIDSLWYHFDPEGYIDVGWHYIDGSWYYMNNDGVMLAGAEYDGGHLGSDGAWVSDLLPPDNYYVCTEEEEAYWRKKQAEYGLSENMFMDNGDGTYTLSGNVGPGCVLPDFYNTIMAAAALRFNGFTSVFQYENDNYTFDVYDVKYPYDWQ